MRQETTTTGSRRAWTRQGTKFWLTLPLPRKKNRSREINLLELRNRYIRTVAQFMRKNEKCVPLTCRLTPHQLYNVTKIHPRGPWRVDDGPTQRGIDPTRERIKQASPLFLALSLAALIAALAASNTIPCLSSVGEIHERHFPSLGHAIFVPLTPKPGRLSSSTSTARPKQGRR